MFPTISPFFSHAKLVNITLFLAIQFENTINQKSPFYLHTDTDILNITLFDALKFESR